MASDSGERGSRRSRTSVPSADPHDTSMLVPIVLGVVLVGALALAIVSFALPKTKSRPRSAALGGEPSAPSASPFENSPEPPVETRTSTRPTAPSRTTTAPPTPKLHDRSEALLAIKPAEQQAKMCLDGTVERVRVVVTFGPDGHVQEAKLIDAVGDRADLEACVLDAFRQPQLAPFHGKPVTVIGSVLADE